MDSSEEEDQGSEPMIVEEAHTVNPDEEQDRTWDQDREKELRKREQRNRVIEKKLRRGQTVAYRSSGRSLEPEINNNDLCVFLPVKAHQLVETGDIVFCRVQESNQYYAHKVLSKRWSRTREKWVYIIGNKAGHSNGWCYQEHIFGVCVKAIAETEHSHSARGHYGKSKSW